MIRTIIVDDEMLARIGMRSFLEEQDNIKVEADFSRAQDALDYLINNKGIDIVITDIEMSVMNGLEFIKNLKELNIVGAIIIVSCHNNFNYAQEAIRLGADAYILKQEISEEILISEINKIYKEKDLVDRGKITARFETLPPEKLNEDYIYTVGVLKFQQDYDEYGDIIATTVDKSMLVNLLDSILLKHQIGTLFVPYKKDMFIIFQFPKDISEKKREKELVEACHYLKENVKIYVNKTLIIGISDVFISTQEVSNYYEDAIKATELQFYDCGTNNNLFFWKRESPSHIPELEFTSDKFLDEDGIEQFTAELYQYFIKCRNNKTEVQKVKRYLIKKLNIFIYQLLHQYSFSEEIVKRWDDKIQYFESINKIDDFKILIEKLESIMKDFQIDLLVQLKNDEFNIVFQFINKNIEKKISLEEMSELSCMSTASFCKKFKDRTGMTLVQYINLKRIEQVEILIMKNKYSLGEISEMVGFSNENYMTRVFKKVKRQTITEYRKINKY